ARGGRSTTGGRVNARRLVERGGAESTADSGVTETCEKGLHAHRAYNREKRMIFRQMMIGAAAAAIMVASTGFAAADTWRYATEEAAAGDVQNVFAQKF